MAEQKSKEVEPEMFITTISVSQEIHRKLKGRVPTVVEKEKGVFSRYPKKKLAHGVSQTEEEYA
jgi:hypothetical protein